MESFYNNITIVPLILKNIKNNQRGILGVLTKISLNLNTFPPIPPNFEGNKNLRFRGKREE